MKYNNSSRIINYFTYYYLPKRLKKNGNLIHTNTNQVTAEWVYFHDSDKNTKKTNELKVIKITQSKNPSNLPPVPPLSPLISSFVRISMRLEGNRNYAWRLFIKLIAPSSLALPSRSRFPFPTERNVITAVRAKSADLPRDRLPPDGVRRRLEIAPLSLSMRIRFNEPNAGGIFTGHPLIRGQRSAWWGGRGSRNTTAFHRFPSGILLSRDGGKGAACPFFPFFLISVRFDERKDSHNFSQISKILSN